MHLVIDCYNLLHETMPPNLAGLDEDRLCRLLASSWGRRARVTVVCDGRPKPFALRSPVPEVQLLYSGRRKSADDVILQIVETESAPRRVTVVSSDRQIQKAARRRRCKVHDSAQFIRLLARQPPAPSGSDRGSGGAGRPEALDEQEVERWMREFGLD